MFTMIHVSASRLAHRRALLTHLRPSFFQWQSYSSSQSPRGQSNGTSNLAANWEQRPSSVGRAIFNGVCIGFLGVTGFECTPTYIEAIGPKDYGRVIRNLLWSAMVLNVPLMLFVYVHLPNEDILSGANVLSLLAEKVAGKWLRILLVIDASLVLAGGVLTGLFTACGLLQTLAQDGVLPKLFLRTMPVTGGPTFTVIFFIVGCITLYASSTFSLSTITSSVFSVSFLMVMFLVGFLLVVSWSIFMPSPVYCFYFSAQVQPRSFAKRRSCISPLRVFGIRNDDDRCHRQYRDEVRALVHRLLIY
jgi:amino acid transporter